MTRATTKLEGPVVWAFGAEFLRGLPKLISFVLRPDRKARRAAMSAALIQAPLPEGGLEPDQDYYFDFIADTGDSGRATYSIAYLLHGDLWVSDPEGAAGTDDPSKLSGATVSARRAAGASLLPRGAFAVAGNDSAYPVATASALESRLLAPFNLAYERRYPQEKPKERLLAGVPGNHDWYDNLEGYDRLYRRGSAPATEPLALKGFYSEQTASYFALELPGGAQLWALDGLGKVSLDERQQRFFRELKGRRDVVLLTASPPVSNGHPEPWIASLLTSIGLEKSRVRVWITGDSHHYARYAGPNETGGAPCLVCGLGGAALHAPLRGPIEAARLHPEPQDAAEAVRRRLVSPRFMTLRTGVWGAGAVFGFAFGAALLFARDEGRRVAEWLGLRSPDPALSYEPWTLFTLLGALAVTIALGVLLSRRVAAKDGPVERRGLPEAAFVVLAGFVSLILTWVLVPACAEGRTVSGVMIDTAFYLFSGLVPLALPAFLLSGLPPPRSASRISTLAAAGLGAGLVFLAAALGGAWLATSSLAGSGEVPFALGGALGAALGGALALPSVYGLALSAALSRSSLVEVASSTTMIDEHQAFVRFRLRRREGRSLLTAFVIGVTRTPEATAIASDENAENGSAAVPEAVLLDVFTVPLAAPAGQSSNGG